MKYVMTIALIFSFVVAVVRPNSAYAAAADDVLKHTKWGMTTAEVQATLSGTLMNDISINTYETLLNCTMKEYGTASMITFGFTNSKLSRIHYTIYGDNPDLTKSIIAALNQKYGKPRRAKSPSNAGQVVLLYSKGNTILEFSEGGLGISLHYYEASRYKQFKKMVYDALQKSQGEFQKSF